METLAKSEYVSRRALSPIDLKLQSHFWLKAKSHFRYVSDRLEGEQWLSKFQRVREPQQKSLKIGLLSQYDIDKIWVLFNRYQVVREIRKEKGEKKVVRRLLYSPV